MALYTFPLAIECLEDLANYCEFLVVRWDAKGDKKLLQYAINHPKVIKIVISKEKWNAWNWREDLVGVIDSLSPDLCLFLDEDEKFEHSIMNDLESLMANPVAKYLRFSFKMVPETEEIFPNSPHVKVFKWMPKLTYCPYPGWARLSSYLGLPGASMNAKSKIIHYNQFFGKKDKH